MLRPLELGLIGKASRMCSQDGKLTQYEGKMTITSNSNFRMEDKSEPKYCAVSSTRPDNRLVILQCGVLYSIELMSTLR